MKTVRIGSRGSLLALAQAHEIRCRLKSRFPKIDFRIVVVKTTGDEFQSVELFKKKNIGVFTKALEEKLMRQEIDMAVHSLKDLPTQLPNGLTLAAFPKRLDARDVLISLHRHTLASLPKGARVGTGSPRRQRQLLHLRPDLKVIDLRGNLDTRIAKVIHEKKLDAAVVAHAGLLRLKKYLKYAVPISSREMLPAVGQAALGIEVRIGDERMLRLAKALNHPQTEQAVLAERSFLKVLQGGCRVPVGISSKKSGGKLHLRAAVFSIQTEDFLTDEITGPAKSYKTLAETLARRLLKKGASKFLKEARA